MHVSLSEAVALLKSGKVVAVPTETVYGLAACLNCPEAIAKIFSLKGRPENNPLIVHMASPEKIKDYVSFLPPAFELLSKAFWPGPLTLVLSAIEDTIPEIARAGLPTVAFRIPSHPVARQLLEQTGPLVMPSANLSGKPSATCAEHVEVDFGIDLPVLDGGACHKGLESTILYWKANEWIIVRLGALAPEDFGSVLGYTPKVVVKREEAEAPLCPGQLYRHYAPKAQLVLTTVISSDGKDVIIGFSDRKYPGGCRVFSLGDSSVPEQAAQRLYAVLRQLDLEGIDKAIVDINIPNTGLWLTLKERLLKAASK